MWVAAVNITAKLSYYQEDLLLFVQYTGNFRGGMWVAAVNITGSKAASQ